MSDKITPRPDHALTLDALAASFEGAGWLNEIHAVACRVGSEAIRAQLANQNPGNDCYVFTADVLKALVEIETLIKDEAPALYDRVSVLITMAAEKSNPRLPRQKDAPSHDAVKNAFTNGFDVGQVSVDRNGEPTMDAGAAWLAYLNGGLVSVHSTEIPVDPGSRPQALVMREIPDVFTEVPVVHQPDLTLASYGSSDDVLAVAQQLEDEALASEATGVNTKPLELREMAERLRKAVK